MVPYDLTTLHSLRRRGQCPKLPVFVTDRWDWQRKLSDLGSLCIRLQSPKDHQHDWTAIRGLHCILLCPGDTLELNRSGRYEQLAWTLIQARPSQFEAFYEEPVYGRAEPAYSTLILGEQEPIDKIIQRDALLWRLLRH